MSGRAMSRRNVLRLFALGLGYSALAACAPKVVEVTKIVEKEKIVEKPVEKVVKETVVVEGTPKVVEKLITVAPTKAPEPTKAPVTASVPREKTLIIGFEEGPVADPEQGNILVPGSRRNTGYHQLMMESLYYLNYQDAKMIPWLASGPEKFNATYDEITVPIRQGVTWNDGKPFTADDVVFTVNLLKDNPTLGWGGAMSKWVKACTAPDQQTVKFVLTAPNPRFIFQNFAIHIWGSAAILPKHIWEGQDPMKFRNFDLSKGWPVHTGPYKLVKVSSTEFVFDRDDNWWAAKTGLSPLPAPQRVVFTEQGDESNKASMLESNRVDGLPSLGYEAFAKVREKNPNAIGWMEQAPYTWVDPCPWSVKFQVETKPWDDPEMRWALSYGLDRDKLAKTMGGGFGIPARFVFPMYPGIDKFLDDNKDLFEKYPTTKYDPAAAKAIFEKKGYKLNKDGIYEKGGQKLTVDILGPAPGTGQIMLSAFWKQIGVDATLKLVSVAVYHDTVANSQFQADAGWSYCGSVTDPFATMETAESKWYLPAGQRHSGDWMNWKNAEYDKAVDAMGMLPAGDERIKPLFRTALELWLKDVVVIGLTQQLRVVPYTTKYWTNWPTEKNGYFHPPNWWQCFLMVVLKIKPAGG